MGKNWNIRIVVHGNERIVYSGSDFQKASACIGEILLQEQIQQMRIWQDGALFQVIDISLGPQQHRPCAESRQRKVRIQIGNSNISSIQVTIRKKI